jgi:hypothetical protein
MSRGEPLGALQMSITTTLPWVFSWHLLWGPSKTKIELLEIHGTLINYWNWHLGRIFSNHLGLGLQDLRVKVARFKVLGFQDLGFWISLNTFWQFAYKMVHKVWRRWMEIWCWKKYTFQSWLIIMCVYDLV